MDWFVNNTAQSLAQQCEALSGQNRENLTIQVAGILPWLSSRLRVFLYLSSPYEESFEFDHQVPDYHTEAFPLLISFVFIEWIILWLKGKPIPFLGDSAASSSMIVMMECFRIFTRGLEHAAYVYVYNNYRIIDLPWYSTITWYAAAIFVDFCAYWSHRFSHEVNFLWAHHQAHHSSESYTLVNTFRLPLLQDLLQSFVAIPLAIAISPAHYLVHKQLNLLYQFWLHTEIVGNLGPLEWVFNTPSHHRIHHGSNKFCLDRNYAQWLIIWDKMFGTFQENVEDEEIVYGLVDQPQSFNPLYLQLFYLKKVYEKWCSMEGWRNKLESLIKGPGWRPGSPWIGYITDVPDVKGRKRYAPPPLPLWKNVYALIHFFIVLFAYELVILFQERMTPTAVLLHLVYIMFTLTAIGMLFDGHPLTPFIEFLRCGFFCFYSQRQLPILSNSFTWAGMTKVFGNSVEFGIYEILRAYFFVSVIYWGYLIVCGRIWHTLPYKIKTTIRTFIRYA